MGIYKEVPKEDLGEYVGKKLFAEELLEAFQEVDEHQPILLFLQSECAITNGLDFLHEGRKQFIKLSLKLYKKLDIRLHTTFVNCFELCAV